MRRAWIGLCWLVALVVGWEAGRRSVPDPEGGGEPRRATRSSDRDHRGTSPEQRRERMNALAALPHPRLEQRLELEKLVSGLPMDELRRLAGIENASRWGADLNDASAEERTDVVLRGLAIDEWSRRDPFTLIDSGIRLADGIDPFDNPKQTHAWRSAAHIDPARMTGMLAAPAERIDYGQRTSAFLGLADAAPELAFAVARELPLDQFKYMDHAKVAEGFADPLRRLEWAELAIERAGWEKQPAAYQIFRSVAEDDPTSFGRAGHLSIIRKYADEISNTLEAQAMKNLPPGSPLADDFDGPDGSGWDDRGRRIERWFAADPAAATAWLKALPDAGERRSRLSALANSAVMRDLGSLDRVLEVFSDPGDREAVMRCAVLLLSDFNMSAKAALFDFVRKHPEARQYVRRPQMLEP